MGMTDAQLLATARAALDCSWSELARVLGVTTGAVGHWRRGVYPMNATARQLCRALTVAPSLAEILRDPPPDG
ncbi:MAG: helix-turn-helix domain-containing protein [Pseudomonadota bacterium]